MKNLILLCLLSGLFYSCSPSSSSSTTPTPSPASTFSITLNGHTYNLTSGGNTSITVETKNFVNLNYNKYNPLPENVFKVSIVAGDINKSINFVCGGIKSDITTGTGVYSTGRFDDGNDDHYRMYDAVQIIDYGDGGKIYSADTTSTITITASNSTEISGTFSLDLRYNGVLYPATGSFNYIK